jgi:hypothetical protein
MMRYLLCYLDFLFEDPGVPDVRDLDLRLDGFDDFGVTVPEYKRPEREVLIDILFPVYVPRVRPCAALECDHRRFSLPLRIEYPARRHRAGPIEKFLGTLGLQESSIYIWS